MPTTASRRSSKGTRPRRRASRPSRKPSSTPGEPSGGELSKVTFTGPVSLVAWPLRPCGAPEGLVVDRHALRHRPLGHALGELVAVARQRRVVGDPRRERGRDGDDGAPGADRHAVGGDGDAVRVVGDRAAPGADSSMSSPQRLGELERHELRAADEALLLRASRGPDERVEAAGAVRVEEDVEHREVGRLLRPHGLAARSRRSSGRPASRRCAAATWRRSAPSSSAAFAASQGASSGTLRARRSRRNWACADVGQDRRVDAGIEPV